jgi:hypothetical protein
MAALSLVQTLWRTRYGRMYVHVWLDKVVLQNVHILGFLGGACFFAKKTLLDESVLTSKELCPRYFLNLLPKKYVYIHRYVSTHWWPSLNPGTNHTIVSYNASVVNIYNTTSSLVPFENKNIFFNFEKTL